MDIFRNWLSFLLNRFAWLAVLFEYIPVCFCIFVFFFSSSHPFLFFYTRKTKDAALKTLKVVISGTISLWLGTLTRWQLAAIVLWVKRKWTHKQKVFVWVHARSTVCNKGSKIKTTALFNIHYLLRILLLARFFFFFFRCGDGPLPSSQGLWGSSTLHPRTPVIIGQQIASGLGGVVHSST